MLTEVMIREEGWFGPFFFFFPSFSALVCCPMTTVWLVQIVEWGVCERVWSLQRIGWSNERSARVKRDAKRTRIRTRRMDRCLFSLVEMEIGLVVSRRIKRK